MAGPNNFGGVQDFVGALMGGSTNEAAAYDARMQRLINQRSSAALMDKRIQDAITAKQEADAMIALNTAIEDPLVRALTQSGTGSSYSGAQTGEKQRMQNELIATIAPLLQAAAEGGQGIPVDALNALIAGGTGKLMSPSNVNVLGQANADEAAASAMARYRDALTGKATAQTGTENIRQDLVRQQIETEQARGVKEQNLGNRYVMDAGLAGARTDLVNAQTGYWDERYRGGPSASSGGKAPFSNAAFVNAILGTPNEETGMYDVNQDFFKWQAIMSQKYPELAPGVNDRLAYGAYISKDDPNFNLDAYLRKPAPTQDQEPTDPLAAITGSEEPAAADTPVVTTEEDARMLIQVAQEMIQANPEQADAINANLQAALAKAGFQYAPNERTGSGSP